MHLSTASKTLSSAVLALVLAGCGSDAMVPPKPDVAAAFYVAFDQQGELIIIDQHGKPLEVVDEPARIPGPAVIKRATQISVLEVEGSHYFLVYVNGRVVKVPMKH